MTRITDKTIINSRTEGDCSPRFEAIIGQLHIGSIWAHSDADGTIFDATVCKQFVGVMHAGTVFETTWKDEDCGFIEDGAVRKGEIVSTACFTEFAEALDHLMAETKRLLMEQFGGLDADSLAV